jgi:hypothetical protein
MIPWLKSVNADLAESFGETEEQQAALAARAEARKVEIEAELATMSEEDRSSKLNVSNNRLWSYAVLIIITTGTPDHAVEGAAANGRGSEAVLAASTRAKEAFIEEESGKGEEESRAGAGCREGAGSETGAGPGCEGGPEEEPVDVRNYRDCDGKLPCPLSIAVKGRPRLHSCLTKVLIALSWDLVATVVSAQP